MAIADRLRLLAPADWLTEFDGATLHEVSSEVLQNGGVRGENLLDPLGPLMGWHLPEFLKFSENRRITVFDVSVRKHVQELVAELVGGEQSQNELLVLLACH